MAESEEKKGFEAKPFVLNVNTDEDARIDKYRAHEHSLTELYPASMKDSGTEVVEAVSKNTYVTNPKLRDNMIACAEIHRSLHDHPAILKVVAIYYRVGRN